MKISILGFGSWGTAISQVLANNGHSISAWTVDERIVESMKWHENPYYFPRKKLSENITVSTDLNRVCKDSEMIVIAVPTQAIREIIKRITDDSQVIVSLSKGIEINSGRLIHQIIAEELHITERYVALSGPTHAEEVMVEIPTNIVAAGTDEKTLTLVQNTFGNDFFRVYTNDDILGVELCGALKNIYAIAAGVIDGLGPWDNTKAALITRAVMEIRRFGEHLGARRETFLGLAGVGDMIVTCTSKHSRNRYVGEHLGRGGTIEAILKDMNMVAEGVYTSLALKRMLERQPVEMPIAEKIYEVIHEGKNPKEAIQELMNRCPKPEFW
ncbi:MAG TPA: NAD(P)H-dependent glycerol-3-phosphate dehydrogenase [Thermotogota bacterium]|nr:NAD(P)H-dependent glycerol-3-phosphate dehydrogenase [Thermotogota bacterium]HPJ87586.1 NAD(P)H-dependent glycerol-3-phosphate dehydrogenase [Thermotogota bacterium]HPR94791.1 NAD(P)H-dependent glycerol-3-phosphate dehydrogenase [Thermotogota bacterium]